VPRPEIEDLAIALAETLDALGLEQVALYGSHTGALICAQFAIRWPQRVSVVLVDGYPVYSEEERARRVATYLPQFEVSWDGSHLLWLWCRYREQYLFWPWNIPGEITQAKCDVPDPEFLHEGVIDLLRAGNGYRLPYMAAFRCRSLDLIGKLRVPTYFLAYPDDSLTANLSLLHDMPTCCHIENMSSDRVASTEKEISLVRAHMPKFGNANLNTKRRNQGTTKSYVDAEGTWLALRAAGPAHGRPLVVIAPAPGSASMLMPEIEQFATTRSVLVLDAPGCGDSDACTSITVPGMARTLNAALDAIGIGEADMYALHGGCAVAIELAVLRESKVRRMVLDAPARPHLEIEAYSARYALPIEPRWDGSHLIALWHTTRNRRLFRPWFDQRLERRYTDMLALEPEPVNRDVLAYLESWRTYHLVWRTVLDYPVLQRAQTFGHKVRVVAQASDEFAVPDSALPEPILPRVQKILALFDNE
jgi:pimeloyl-ACP methyl ester carboxylesterase